MEKEAGKLYEIQTGDAQAALDRLQAAGYSSAALFGSRVHVLMPDDEQALRQMADVIADTGVLKVSPKRLAMEDVFVHIVTRLEAEDAKARGEKI